MKFTTFVGLDVHKEKIAVAVARDWREVESLGSINNNPNEIKKLFKKLGSPETTMVCYEAGPCGYSIYRQLWEMGFSCMVVAPSLIPKKPGDRVKTDRRDAMNLARLLRSGQLDPVWVPDEEHEAFRQLVRAREDTVEDIVRKKHQISKLLLINGISAPEKYKAWSAKYLRWLDSVTFKYECQTLTLRQYRHILDELQQTLSTLEAEIARVSLESKLSSLIAGLQAMRGVCLITSATIVAEVGDLTRFQTAAQAMSYSGLVPSEHSSGSRTYRGPITKAGNAHLRRVLIEAAWHYRRVPVIGERLKKRQKGVSDAVKAIAWKAQNRLNLKYRRCIGRNKPSQVGAVAVARELIGFMWAIAQEIKSQQTSAA